MSSIAVTGLGCISALGSNANSSSDAYLSGKSCTSLLEDDWAKDLTCRLASRVSLDTEAVLGEFLGNRLDRCGQLALLAAREAWTQAQIDPASLDPQRLAVVEHVRPAGARRLSARRRPRPSERHGICGVRGRGSGRRRRPGERADQQRGAASHPHGRLSARL